MSHPTAQPGLSALEVLASTACLSPAYTRQHYDYMYSLPETLNPAYKRQTV